MINESNTNSAPLKILIIDDSASLRDLLRKQLEALGHAFVAETDNGTKGLKLALGGAYDIIFLDYLLPDIQGIYVLQKLKEQKCKSHVVVVTGNESVKLATESMKLGAVDFIVKPFTKEEIEVCINRINGLNSEITRRTKELREAKDKAELADKAKSAFLAHASHEMRTPLHNILSNAELALMKKDCGYDKLVVYFDRIQKAAQRQLLFINDILDMAPDRVRASKVLFQKKQPLRSAKNQINEATGKAEEKKLKINFLYDGEDIKLHYDRKRIGEVIMNLLGNCIKFSPENSNINVGIQKDELECLVSIKDEGIGIPENEIANIFDKFIQSSKNKEVGGTGLGLSISKAIIEAHKGRIWAENNKDKGTTFFFTLPALEEDSLSE